jgi:xanthine dehydrogenase accessory factor
MAFTGEREIAGSVSGGCVEGAVLAAGARILKGEPPRLLHFEVPDETAWRVGLTCGGSLDVFISRFDGNLLGRLQAALQEQQPVAMITGIRGPIDLLGQMLLMSPDGSTEGSLGQQWDAAAVELAREGLDHGESGRFELPGDSEIFRDVFAPQPSLVMVGGVHVAQALAPLARILGWRTVLIDPRRAWGNDGRFADVDQLLQSWPDDALRQIQLSDSTAVVTLTHDPKLDDASLLIALRSEAFYVGALGSAGSHEKRRMRLQEGGLTEAEISQLHAPVGLPIGARSPQEIALAIMAQIVFEYHAARQRSQRAPVAHSSVGSGMAR